MSVLDEIVKAYDVRGTVPDQLYATSPTRSGSRSPRSRRRLDGVRRSRHAPVRPRASSPRSPGECSPRASTSSTSGWCRRTCSTSPRAVAACRARSSPRRTTRPSTTASRCASPAPVRGRPVAEIKPIAAAVLDGHGPAPAARAGQPQRARTCSTRSSDHVVSFVDVDHLRPLRVVADTANGMGGLVVPAVFERLGVFELEVMYGELDGTFPNHPADPLQPANQTRPAGPRRRRRFRRRAGVRRRRRPRVRRRRDRHRPLRLDDDGDARRRRRCATTRARRSSTT